MVSTPKGDIFAFMLIFLLFTLDDAFIGVSILLGELRLCLDTLLVCRSLWRCHISLGMFGLVMMTLDIASTVTQFVLYATLIITHYAMRALTYSSTVYYCATVR